MFGAEKRPSSIHGHGLFAITDVPAGKFLIEYTGMRRSGASATALHRAFDYRHRYPDGLVSVNVDKGDEECVIDPRMSGNDAKYLNHSCDPNCILVTVPLIDRYIVKVLALRPLEAGMEATVNFGRNTRASRHRITCNCQSPFVMVSYGVNICVHGAFVSIRTTHTSNPFYPLPASVISLPHCFFLRQFFNFTSLR